MRKSIVFVSIAIIVVGMLTGLRLFASEEPYDGSSSDDGEQSVGKALMEMEHESDDRVEQLRGEIEAGRLSEADCQIEIEDMVRAIFDNLSRMEEGTGSYLNLAYNCNVIRKLGLGLEDRQDMADAELELKRDNLTRFTDKVFNYSLDVSAKTEEKADYMQLSEWATEIEENLDQEIGRYTDLLYAWYREKGKNKQ